MNTPGAFHKRSDLLEIGAEVPVHPEDQNESFAGNVPDPEIAGHVIIPAQRRHQRIYEDIEPYGFGSDVDGKLDFFLKH